MIMVLEAVSKRYSRRTGLVIRDVDLVLPVGSTTVVSGANGSGKSTVLRIIAGLSRPTTGAVHGRPARVAVVPDRFVPPARMTAGSYLRHHGRLHGLSASAAARRAGELAEQLRIVPGLDAAMEDLSKGNAQKVALAQAFIAPADLLVLDEPGTALDDPTTAALDELLAAACARGATVVLSDPGAGGDRADVLRYELSDGRLHSTRSHR